MPKKSLCSGLQENECNQLSDCKWSEKYNFCHPKNSTNRQITNSAWMFFKRQEPNFRERENIQKLTHYHTKKFKTQTGIKNALKQKIIFAILKKLKTQYGMKITLKKNVLVMSTEN
jgi:NH3-dependent NAD+ synthetase